MREMVLGAAAAVTAGGAYVTYEPGEVYNMPISEVANLLDEQATPEALSSVLHKARGLDLNTMREGNDRISWVFKLNNAELGRFEANLFDKGGKATRVTVEFKLAETSVAGLSEKEVEAKGLQSSLIKNVAEFTLGEQVDAVLDKRAYDTSAVGQQVTTYLITHGGEVASFKTMLDAKAIGDSVKQVVRSNVESIADQMELSTEQRHDFSDRMDNKKVRYSD